MKRLGSPRPRAVAVAALASALLAACGSSNGKIAGSAVTGVAYGDAAISGGTVTLADASSASTARTVTTRPDGSYSVDVSGLTPPFLIKVAYGAGGAQKLYAVAEGSEHLDVTPVTDLAVAYAAGDADPDTLLTATPARKTEAALQARAVLTDFNAQLAPLLNLYGIANLRTDSVLVRQLLQDVSVTVDSGVVTFKNRRTGGEIQRGPIGNAQGGTWNGSQLPSGRGGSASGSSNGSAQGSTSGGSSSSNSTSNLPANHPAISSGTSCSTCHGGGSNGGGPTSGGMPSSGGMSSGGTSSSGGLPPLPPGSSSGGMPSSGGLPPLPPGSSSGGMSSSGGLPPLPPGSSSSGAASSGGSSLDGAALYASRCANCHGALATSTHRGATAAQILSRHSNLVTSAEATAIAAALSGSSTSPGGTTSSSGGLPPAPPGSSSSGGTTPSSSGATSSGSSSATGSACGYGSNTAALAVTSGTKSTSAAAYSAANADESGVCVVNAGATLTLTNPSITTSGNTSSQDNSSFYGQNAAALAYTGATLNLTGGTINSTGTGANGVFAYGTGTANVEGTTIVAKGQGGHGIMTAGGGTLVAKNVTATTYSAQGSVIATDRGTGNKITVTGGTFIAYGMRSAGVYSTGAITVSDAVLTANAAEGAVIEGKNSAVLNNCTITSTNANDRRGMFVYQSFSGDAAVGQGVLTLNGGSYTWNSTDATSAAFYSTNTTGVINLNGVKITNPTGYLLHAEANSWGTSGSNGGMVTFNAKNQTLQGEIVVDSVSTLAASFTSSSSYTGAINAANTGRSVTVALDGSSLWTASGTSYVHSLTGVALSGSTVSNIAGSSSASVCYKTSFTDTTGTVHTSGDYSLKNGGTLRHCS